MARKNLPLFALVLAAGMVGAAAAGIPVTTLLPLLLVLACPLMMLFMHGGHGMHNDHREFDRRADDSDRSPDRRRPEGSGTRGAA